MKLQYIFVLIAFVFGTHALANEYQGQVIFYSYLESTTKKQDQAEIDSDFSYHVGNLLSILDKKNIKHQVNNSSEFTVIAINGENLKINKKQIPISTGYIMIKKNGKYLIRNGMGTDVDMMLDIYQYFGIKP